MAVLFDTLKLAERLEAAGLPSEQAKGTAAALAETLTGTVATTADVEASELRLRTEIATVRTEIANLRADLWKWAGGAVVVIIGAVAALLRLLH